MTYTGNYQERMRRMHRHLFDEQSDERQAAIHAASKRLHAAYWNDRRSVFERERSRA